MKVMRVLIVSLIYFTLVSCNESKTCHADIICDPDKEGECENAYEEAQKSCGKYQE